MMGEQDEELARLTDLDVTWGFDLHAFSRDRSQETPAAGDAGDLHACLQERPQEAPVAGECWRRNSRDDGFVSRGRGIRLFGPGREGRNSRDDIFVSRGRDGRLLGPGREGQYNSDASAAPGTDQGNREGPPAVLSGRPAQELSSWGRLPGVTANACGMDLLNVSM